MSGAVDLTALKERADAQRAAAQSRGPAPQSPPAAAPAQAGQAPTAAGGAAVIDVTDATFETDVIERSTRQLVIVDLWATWCGPCKQLSPILESLAAQANGAWVLAKVDVDANPGIAQAFRAQSIPMVIAIAQGQPVTAFQGVQPAGQVAAWIDDILAKVGHTFTGAPGEAVDEPVVDERMAAADDKMNAGDFAGALEAYKAIVAEEPGNLEAASLVRNLEFMIRASAHDPSIVQTAAPGDVDAQLAAADVLLANQQPEAAFDRIIALVKVASGDDRTAARTRLLQLFELFDPAEPFVVTARRKLASALF